MTDDITQEQPTEQSVATPPLGTPAPPAERDPEAEAAARAPLPPETEDSGQFAVYDETAGQYVSGVGDEKGAKAALKSLQGSESFHNGMPLEGHKLTVRQV